MKILHETSVKVHIADIECDCGEKLHLSQMAGLDDWVKCKCGLAYGLESLLAEREKEAIKKLHLKLCDKANDLNKRPNISRDYAMGLARAIEFVWNEIITQSKKG